MIENDNYRIICDTNVLLRLYDYSPEFAFFAIKCLNTVQGDISITYTTQLEYEKHHRGKYNYAKSKIEKIDEKFVSLTNEYKNEVFKEFNRIAQYRFPDIDTLKNRISNIILMLSDTFTEYSENHELLVAVNERYLETDSVYALYQNLFKMTPYSFERLYQICDEGYKRYKNKQPPGFMDKGKDGIRLYCDLILWNEILDYSINEDKNIIFITDDVKDDWWETRKLEDGSITKNFHSKLVSEFEKKTNHAITAYTSSEFFELIATEFSIEKTSEVDLALSQTTDSFVDAIQFKAFERIEDELVYSQEKYVDTINAHIGSEGLSEFEVEDYELIGYQLYEQNNETIYYELTYQVKLSATSCEYWGRDDDTKEIITSPDNQHIFIGDLVLMVERCVDDFIDLLYDSDFDNVEIISCELEEAEYIEWSDEPDEKYEDYCPKCGKGLTFESDAVNGYCRECTDKYDI